MNPTGIFPRAIRFLFWLAALVLTIAADVAIALWIALETYQFHWITP